MLTEPLPMTSGSTHERLLAASSKPRTTAKQSGRVLALQSEFYRYRYSDIYARRN